MTVASFKQADAKRERGSRGDPLLTKHTAIGPLPASWDVERIGKLATIKTGAKNTQDRQEDGDYPFFVRSQHVERINSFSFDGEAVLTAGDGVGTGKVFHYINGRFDVHQRVYRISSFSDRLNAKYFFFQFSTRFFDRIMSMTAKSSVDSVRMEMIAAMEIPLPEAAEQETIAAALSDADAVIASLDRLIAKKRAIKQAAMQQLLTGKTRLPAFRSRWRRIQLGELGAFAKGAGIKRGDVSLDGLPCIRYGQIYTDYSNYAESLVSFIPPSVASTSYPILPRDLLFTASGETAEEIGKCVAYVGTSAAYAGGDIIVLRLSGDDDPVYLAHLINHPIVARERARFGQGDAVVHISARSLARLQLELPDSREQAAIAKVLTDIDQHVSALARRRNKARAIKQGMMQALLTGRVRLV